jgi:deoxycytidylate deaminase
MIISDGYNGTPTGFENCCEDDEGLTRWDVLHAEANAIKSSKVHSILRRIHSVYYIVTM